MKKGFHIFSFILVIAILCGSFAATAYAKELEPCRLCGGNGEYHCSSCGNTGTVTCGSCGGLGTWECPGEGRLYRNE